VFVISEGSLAVFGSDPQADRRLPGLAARHAVVRFAGVFEVRNLDGAHQTRLNGQPLLPDHWLPLRPGDTLTLSGYQLRVELLGLDAETMIGTQATARLAPEIHPPSYELEGRLGSGGFGTVFAARRRSDGLRVALKILTRRPNPSLLARFSREFEACKSFDHPNIVRVIEADVESFPPFVAMELVAGPSAGDLVEAGPLALPKALKITIGLADALSALAAAGLVHRDVKPANVLVAPGDVAKLADFGLVKDMEEVFSTLTMSGMGMGTLAYAAPEQLNDAKHVGPKADVYSMGASLFQLLAGRPPFELTTAIDVRRVFREQPPELGSLRADCPPAVQDVVRAALSKAPEDRPSSAEVSTALRAVLNP
jgi:serine/threonine-protein kinase